MINNVSVSQLVNQVDKSESFTLYAEWEDTEDTCLKIMILRSCTVPLRGEMRIGDAKYFMNYLDESFETYLEKTKHAFSGKNADIQFFLEDDTFTWKHQNILTRGEIAVHSLSNILILSDTLKQSLEMHQKCQERALALENENEQLDKTNRELIADIKEMMNKKTTMEKELYIKFLLLLNTKKKKNRELQEALDNAKKTTQSVYDKTTDESEGSEVENNEDTSPEPSTSKGNIATMQNMDIDDTIKSKQALKSSEESEEDIFS